MVVYQSHHTGIETTEAAELFEVNTFYQSHHTGIETKNQIHSLYILLSTNRTTLELKHRNNNKLISHVWLPIAPHWN